MPWMILPKHHLKHSRAGLRGKGLQRLLQKKKKTEADKKDVKTEAVATKIVKVEALKKVKSEPSSNGEAPSMKRQKPTEAGTQPIL